MIPPLSILLKGERFSIQNASQFTQISVKQLVEHIMLHTVSWIIVRLPGQNRYTW